MAALESEVRVKWMSLPVIGFERKRGCWPAQCGRDKKIEMFRVDL